MGVPTKFRRLFEEVANNEGHRFCCRPISSAVGAELHSDDVVTTCDENLSNTIHVAMLILEVDVATIYGLTCSHTRIYAALAEIQTVNCLCARSSISVAPCNRIIKVTFHDSHYHMFGLAVLSFAAEVPVA